MNIKQKIEATKSALRNIPVVNCAIIARRKAIAATVSRAYRADRFFIVCLFRHLIPLVIFFTFLMFSIYTSLFSSQEDPDYKNLVILIMAFITFLIKIATESLDVSSRKYMFKHNQAMKALHKRSTR